MVPMKATDTLRQAMERSGLTRYQISQETGIAESVLSRFASGERTLSGQNIDKLADYLGLELKPKRRKGR